jgi:tetratricopeptide (TPR) repeat protein
LVSAGYGSLSAVCGGAREQVSSNDVSSKTLRRIIVSRNTVALAAIGLVLALVAVPALAAGSKTVKEEKPGVADYNKGVKLMKKGAYSDAQTQFEAALAENEEFAEAHNNLAFSLRKLGKDHWDLALEHYNRAIELKPKLAEAYMYRGVLYSLMGDEESALEDHAMLVNLDRKLAKALQAAIASGEEPEGLEGLAKAW